MARSSIRLIALLVPTALVACGSGGSTGTGSGGSTTTAATTGTSSSTTTGTSSSATTGAGGSAGDAGSVAACVKACQTEYAAAYTVFSGYELTNCGCAAGSDCNTECAASCTGGMPNMTAPSKMCKQCLTLDAVQGGSSTCTAASEATCEADPTCAPFVTCAKPCLG
jgi:hypothetical protein